MQYAEFEYHVSSGRHFTKYGGGACAEGTEKKFNLNPGNGICNILRTHFCKKTRFSKHCFNGAFCYKSHAKYRKPTFQRKYLHDYLHL
jgi:hypothetical protein